MTAVTCWPASLEPKMDLLLRAYPNHAREEVFFELRQSAVADTPATLTVRDMTGRQVFQQDWGPCERLRWSGK